MRKKLLFLFVGALSLGVSGCTLGPNERSTTSIKPTSTTSTSEEDEGDIDWAGALIINEQNPSAVESSIKQVIEHNGTTDNKTVLYRIAGTVQYPTDYSYGNFDLVDKTGNINVYGLSKSSTSITYSGGEYSFHNNATFGSLNIKAGDVIEIEGIFKYYSYSGEGGIPEFQGYPTKHLKKNIPSIEPVSYTQAEPTDQSGSYYSSISSSLKGDSLLGELHNLMTNTHQNFLEYNGLSSHFRYSDNYNGSSYRCFYSGTRCTQLSREHVWAKSLSGGLFGQEYAGSDLHHIRPCNRDINSERSNALFGIVYGPKSGMNSFAYEGGDKTYYTRGVFEPDNSIKGDIARIIMYVYLHYTKRSGDTQSYYSETALKFENIMSPRTKAEAINLLRKWNAEDPVSSAEISRNNYVYSVQGNRNPFIDHPKYADMIWG